MIITKKTFYEEFWGAKVPVEEIEVNESYDNEVFEILANKIENGDIEVILDELEVCDYYDEDIETIINPFDYLSDNQVAELEKMIEKAIKE